MKLKSIVESKQFSPRGGETPNSLISRDFSYYTFFLMSTIYHPLIVYPCCYFTTFGIHSCRKPNPGKPWMVQSWFEICSLRFMKIKNCTFYIKIAFCLYLTVFWNMHFGKRRSQVWCNRNFSAAMHSTLNSEGNYDFTFGERWRNSLTFLVRSSCVVYSNLTIWGH